MKTFVIPDLHGREDLLVLALTEIAKCDVSGTVVFLGDYVDRGPDSAGVISLLMAGPTPGWTWHCIRGNHEDMVLTCHDSTDETQIRWWTTHGGGNTLLSYDGIIFQEHLEWMDALPRCHWDTHRVYTHAAVSESYELDQQPEAVTQWQRYPDGADIGYRNRHVVHGHTAKTDGPELFNNRTNLDTAAWHTGRLVVGVFDDNLSGGPVETIEVKAID